MRIDHINVGERIAFMGRGIWRYEFGTLIKKEIHHFTVAFDQCLGGHWNWRFDLRSYGDQIVVLTMPKYQGTIKVVSESAEDNEEIWEEEYVHPTVYFIDTSDLGARGHLL